jgi:hypothetical protein
VLRAERAKALMATYNQTLSKNDKRKQDVLEVVENSRKRVNFTSKKELGTYETLQIILTENIYHKIELQLFQF